LIFSILSICSLALALMSYNKKITITVPINLHNNDAIECIQISPVREEPEQVNVPFTMDPDLAQALTNFANGAAQDRLQYQGRHDALMNLLVAQQQESAALRALVTAQQQQAGAARGHVNNAVVESVPMFEGKLGDSGRHWVRILNQVCDAEGWTNAQKRQVAVGRLGGIALQWHLQSGANNPNWQN
jgi:hypothetical protein